MKPFEVAAADDRAFFTQGLARPGRVNLTGPTCRRRRGLRDPARGYNRTRVEMKFAMNGGEGARNEFQQDLGSPRGIESLRQPCYFRRSPEFRAGPARMQNRSDAWRELWRRE